MRSARGFTLLEVMIALAIVALSVGALLGSVSSSASNVIYLHDKTMAEWVALNRLTQIRTWKIMPPEGKRTGYSDMGGVRWQWEQEVTELPVKGMFRIEVRARSTGEAAKDTRPATKPAQQVEPESKSSGGELARIAWMTTVTGVIGTSTSDRQQPLGATYASSAPPGGGGGPGGPNAPGNGNPATPGTPGSPGGTRNPPNNPGSPPGDDPKPPATER
jgi:general secretion pathway protein I